MHAITVEEPGGPEVLTWAELPDPTPGPHEVLVAVRAAGVNRADVHQREGHYPPPPGASDIPGLECSGTVAALGAQVRGWSVGDPVCALLAGGGYAELVAVPEGQLLPAPANVSLSHAAGLPEAACTVWSMVFQAGGLQPDEWLLVHGGTSGIGTFAIQLASALGSPVLATAGTAAKCMRTGELGAVASIDYRSQDFAAAVKEHTGGRGVDVVLDIVGGDYLARNVDVLAPDGRLVVIATQGGRRGELDLGVLMSKRASIHAAGLRARPPAQKAAIVAAVREHVWPLVEAGRVGVVVERELPMPDAAQAHRILEAGGHIGKVLLTTG